MNDLEKFGGPPMETDLERASNGYLMSLVVLMAGLPLPVLLYSQPQIKLLCALALHAGPACTNFVVCNEQLRFNLDPLHRIRR